MRASFHQFEENITRARTLLGLATSLDQLTTPAVDTSDLCRSALVLGVSALDHFVHELVRVGMLEVHAQHRQATRAFARFKVPLSAVQSAASQAGNPEWLDQAIREAHGWLSFQRPDKIAEALRLFTEIQVWDDIAGALGKDVSDVKANVSAIVDRRNKIAHEADLDPTNPGARWPIDAAMVEEALSFLRSIGGELFRLSESKSAP
jgi:hypothetical protein